MVKLTIYTQKWLKIDYEVSKNDNRGGGGGDGINMSRVETNRKINNCGGDDYSGLESTCVGICAPKEQYPEGFFSVIN